MTIPLISLKISQQDKFNTTKIKSQTINKLAFKPLIKSTSIVVDNLF
jgi:hypothetical protein